MMKATNQVTCSAFSMANLNNLVSDGRIFSVEFVKRTTGELRTMRCRTGVKKHLKGGAQAFNAKAKGLLTVFDMEARGYRMIPLEGIQRITIGNQVFQVGGGV